MAVAKPEVVIILGLEQMRFQMLLGPTMFSWVACRHNAILTVVKIHRNLCEIQYGGRQTGSGYNFGPIADKKVVSSATSKFSEIAVTMQHQLPSNFIEIYEKFYMAAGFVAAILIFSLMSTK